MSNLKNFFCTMEMLDYIPDQGLSSSGSWPVWLEDASHGRKRPKVWTFSSRLLQLWYLIQSTEEPLKELKGIFKCRSLGLF